MRLCNLRGGSGLTEMHGWCSCKERATTFQVGHLGYHSSAVLQTRRAKHMSTWQEAKAAHTALSDVAAQA
jgi:hypothetical protein